MILQCAMAHIRREGGLIEILLFFSHEMFIRTLGQIVKLFERTNIFSRKIDKREALRGGMRALYERVWRFDSTLFSESPPPAENPVMKQIDRLRAAAEGGAFDPLSVWRR